MKTTNQTSVAPKANGMPAKSGTKRKVSSTTHKTTSAKRRPTAAAKRQQAARHSVFEGYGDSAARLISRSKAAFGDAYAWAGEAGSVLPRKARHSAMPDNRAIQDFVGGNPLVLGAVGLGIGVALGAMLPSTSRAIHSTKAGNARASTSSKPRRK